MLLAREEAKLAWHVHVQEQDFIWHKLGKPIPCPQPGDPACKTLLAGSKRQPTNSPPAPMGGEKLSLLG